MRTISINDEKTTYTLVSMAVKSAGHAFRHAETYITEAAFTIYRISGSLHPSKLLPLYDANNVFIYKESHRQCRPQTKSRFLKQKSVGMQIPTL